MSQNFDINNLTEKNLKISVINSDTSLTMVTNENPVHTINKSIEYSNITGKHKYTMMAPRVIYYYYYHFIY